MTGQAISRQQRRYASRRLVELGRKALARGLPEPPPEDVLIGIGLVLRERLAEKTNTKRASQAAEMTARLLDREVARQAAGVAVACRRGCAHCCRSVVYASAPEVFRAAAWLEEKATSRDAVRLRLDARRGLSLEEAVARQMPCPLLEADVCGAYTVRPFNCRQVFSRSAEACRRAFQEGVGEVPYLMAAANTGTLVKAILLGAVRSMGLPDASYELSSALGAALEDRACERRWLEGEDVFAGIAVSDRPRTTQNSIDYLAGAIAAHAGP